MLIYSGIIFIQLKREKTIRVRKALWVLREVYQRVAEQSAKRDNKMATIITKEVNQLPERILGL